MSSDDNKFGQCCKCPAMMSDGRLFTNYLSHSYLNNDIQKINNIYNSNHYRVFLQKNSNQIRNNINQFNNNKLLCTFATNKKLY